MPMLTLHLLRRPLSRPVLVVLPPSPTPSPENESLTLTMSAFQSVSFTQEALVRTAR